jgi:5-methylcytosine-specific restriction endonuclease McrA
MGGAHAVCPCGKAQAKQHGLCLRCLAEQYPQDTREAAVRRHGVKVVRTVRCAAPGCEVEYEVTRADARAHCSPACKKRAYRASLSPERRAEYLERERQRENTPTRQAYHAKRDKRITHAENRDEISLEVLAERDLWTCHKCGGVVTRSNWTRDHLLPLSHDGTHTWENVMLAHRSCNSKKGNRVPSLDDLL